MSLRDSQVLPSFLQKNISMALRFFVPLWCALSLSLPSLASAQIQSVNNPLLQFFQQQRDELRHPGHQVPVLIPFDRIHPEHFIPALEQLIAQEKQAYQQLYRVPATFESFVKPFAQHGDIGQLSEIFENLLYVQNTPEMQKVAPDFQRKCLEFSHDIWLDPILFQQFQEADQYEHNQQQKGRSRLDSEDRRLLEVIQQDFKLAGALLVPPQQDQLRQLDQELSSLSLEFGQNVLADTQAFELRIEPKDAVRDLKGMPQRILDQARERAHSQGEEGYLFGLDMPSLRPFLQYCPNRELRHKMFLAHRRKAYNGNDHDNRQIVKRMVELRQKRAQLLGFPSHAAYVLQKHMLHTPQQVQDFLSQLQTATLPYGHKEFEELAHFQSTWSQEHSDTSIPAGQAAQLQRWDYAFLAERLKKQKFDFDTEAIRPYFELNRVLEGLFTVAHKMYGLTFTLQANAAVYHPDVKVYRVEDPQRTGQTLIGWLYVDPYVRKEKRSGAWMTNYRDQAQHQRPFVSLVTNFSASTPQNPTLLSFYEVRTLFHEFGHTLHGLLSQCRYAYLSGTNTDLDFVEFPSQMMENWIYHKECLDLFARHYQTGRLIPEAWLQRLKELKRFHGALRTLRQLCFANLDLALHVLQSEDMQDWSSADLEAFESRTMAPCDLFGHSPGTCLACSFLHLFQGGYSAAYYGYKWSEVMALDVYERFVQEGLLNRDMAHTFRTEILERGNSADPSELFQNLMGRQPDLEAMLREYGFVEEE